MIFFAILLLNMFKSNSANNKKQADLLNRYEDPTGEFTNRDLRFSEWYVRHQVWLKHVVMGFLISIIVVFGGYGLYGIFEYAFYGYGHGERTRSALVKNAVALQTTKKIEAALPITLNEVVYFPASANTVDFVSLASNPNDRWAAEVTYVFANGETSTKEQSVWIWPKQTMPLTALGADQNIASAQSQLVIKKINWRKLDNRTYPNIAQYITDRLTWQVGDFAYTSAATVPGAAFSQVSFSVTNQAIFGYWEVPFIALLKKGDSLVAVKSFVHDGWGVQEKRVVQLTVPVDTLDIDTIEIFANLNLFDTGIYQLTP